MFIEKNRILWNSLYFFIFKLNGKKNLDCEFEVWRDL